MTAVSDTSPLNYLILIGCIDLLPALYERVLVHDEVVAELTHADAPPAVRGWAIAPPPWVRVTPVETGVQQLGSASLHRGERACLALASQTAADVLLLDDYRARQAAKEQGIRVTGTLGVLCVAADMGLVDLRDAVTRLRSTSFHMSAELLRSLESRLRG
ncbi:MAG TPA: DUF3368 domain-containing protein [Armatimonadota bacterium]